MLTPGTSKSMAVTHTVWQRDDGRFEHELVFALANHSCLELVTPGSDPVVRSCWQTGTVEGDFTQLAVRHIDERDDLVWRLVRGELVDHVAI